MPGGPRLALLCALPWLLRAAAPGGPAPPLARRDPHDPARGADFDRVYSGVVNLSTENIYSFSYTSQPGQVNAVRVHVNSSSENLDYPVLVVVRQQKEVLSWQVPLPFQGLYQRTYNYQEVSRTLCPSEATNETGPLEQLIFVDIASMAPLGAQYKLLVTKIKHFQLHPGALGGCPTDSLVLLRRQERLPPPLLRSPACPVYDLDHNVEFNGVYQSMTKKAAITLQKKDFPGEQFFVVFVIKPEDYACGGSFFIQESVFVKSILLSFLIFFSFYVGCLLIAFVHYIRFQRKSIDGSFGSSDGSGTLAVSHPIAASTPEGSSYGAIGISYESIHGSAS
ncbi:hypothetical protein QTO34_014453 [Cnephaeus nilssonii]|uniref:SID1 transmembrane family member 2 n=1 Tax=Cnephaeus nilssonii TaxID=3371016 RepID=A0AA40I6D5_CNENI|nr:hypothetical protein QTO34_014453 [Eptesicus nilssonii]